VQVAGGGCDGVLRGLVRKVGNREITEIGDRDVGEVDPSSANQVEKRRSAARMAAGVSCAPEGEIDATEIGAPRTASSGASSGGAPRRPASQVEARGQSGSSGGGFMRRSKRFGRPG
jgi:hypothetical protein